MIEIITHEVKMPELSDRRYQKKVIRSNMKWTVYDTIDNSEVYLGTYENASLACHNLNKKFYDTKIF